MAQRAQLFGSQGIAGVLARFSVARAGLTKVAAPFLAKSTSVYCTWRAREGCGPFS